MSWETNVLVPASALSALATVRARRGYRSQNKTMVALLEDYVRDQQECPPDERLMHVATLIRHPPPPREAAAREVEPGVRLRLRLDRSLWVAACSLGFALPGQSLRGHADYQARRGADAVLTALARAELLVDPAVGEHQLLTHWQAKRLWRLVVEATRTRAERDIAAAAEAAIEAREIAAARGKPTPADDSEAELIARRLDQDISWHGRPRYQVAAELVAARLRGHGASAFLRLLSCPQGVEEDAWLDEISWCQETFGVEDPDIHAYMGTQGRGAATVWRAARAVRLDAMVAWIAASGRLSTPQTFTVGPPGWRLRLPEEWVPTALPDRPDSGGWGEHVAAGRVLMIEHECHRFVWPTRIAGDGSTEPVPGFEVVTGEIGTTDVRRVAEIVLIGTAEEDPEDGHRLRVPVPAHVACDLGLISTEQRDDQVAAACRNSANEAYRDIRDHSDTTWRVMDNDLVFADLEQRYRDPDDREQARMAFARGVGPFVRYLRSVNHPAVETKSAESIVRDLGTQFVWPVRSLAALLAAGGATEPVLRWLAAWRREQHRRLLYADTAERWISAARYAEEEHDNGDWDAEPDDDVTGTESDTLRSLREDLTRAENSQEIPPF